MNNTLTDEQINMISKTIEDEANKSSDIKTLRDIKEGIIPDELKDEDIESEKVYANIDPTTGRIMNIIPADQIESSDSVSLDDYLDNIEAEDVKISDESIGKSIKNTYGEELSIDDIAMITKAIDKYKETGKVNYSDMPDCIKTQISKTIAGATDKSGSAIYIGNKELRNQMAKAFIETVIQESLGEELSKTMVDLQTMIDDYSKSEISKLYSNATLKQRHILEVETINIANQIESENPEKAKLLREVAEAFKQSYLLEDMYKMCRDTGNLRVKKIELEKISKTYRNFNMKYEKSKNVIKNIELLEPVLDKHLPEYIDMEYIRKFLIIFCKYCQNKNPDNIVDHVFMYYFITNIISLSLFDKTNSEDKEFYDNIINNIVNFIELIKMKEGK